MKKDKSGASKLVDRALSVACAMEDPKISWLLSHLAGISEISFSDDIETACITAKGNRHRILFSEKFTREHLVTDEDILFVMLHEILHRVRGDLVRTTDPVSELDRCVENIVQDIMINASLIPEFRPGSVTLFNSLYDAASFPSLLLVPPAMFAEKQNRRIMDVVNEDYILEGIRGSLADFAKQAQRIEENMERKKEACLSREYGPLWDSVILLAMDQAEYPGNLRWDQFMPEKKKTGPEKLAMWYKQAWFFTKEFTFERLYDTIRPLFPENIPVIILLGSHNGEEIHIPGFPGMGGGYSDDEQDDMIEPVPATRRISRAVMMIKRALSPDPMNPLEAPMITTGRTVIPWAGRREMLWLANGFNPIFYNAPSFVKELDELRPHIYVDVSASTGDMQPQVFGIIAQCADIIGEPVYLFSNTVYEATMNEIREGKMRTTGGTDFNCVMEHAFKNRYRKIVIITDGYGDIEDHWASKVRKGEIDIYIILTEESTGLPDVLKEKAKEVFVL